MNLTKQLKEQKENFQKNAPKEVQDSMLKAHEQLVSQKIADDTLKVSEFFPKFDLLNHKSERLSLSKILESGNYHIITFYRGGWCPYCNLALKSLQNNLDTFKKMDTTLTAITPETPDNSLNTSSKNSLEFNLLTDQNSLIAKTAGISFELPEVLRPIYKEFGIDVVKHNGDEKFTLPVPATFILNNKGKIIFKYVELDYTKRIDPETVINFLKTQSL